MPLHGGQINVLSFQARKTLAAEGSGRDRRGPRLCILHLPLLGAQAPRGLSLAGLSLTLCNVKEHMAAGGLVAFIDLFPVRDTSCHLLFSLGPFRWKPRAGQGTGPCWSSCCLRLGMAAQCCPFGFWENP